MDETKQAYQLIQSLKEGDAKALRQIFDLYYAELVQYSYKLVRNQTISEEIVQELFIKTWERRSSLDIKVSLRAYLMTAVRYRSINYLKNQLPKEQKTTDTESLSDVAEEIIFFEDDSGLYEKVQIAIEQLPAKCKIIFLLSREEGLTYRQIAEELEISEKTVENQISIALKKLRYSLKDDPDFKKIYVILVLMSEIPDFLLGDSAGLFDL